MATIAFTKLYAGITDSSLWDLPDRMIKIWVTMLAMSDMQGYVHASIPGLAARSRKTIAEVEEALEVFRSPDKYSRTREHEGRRIADVDGGWVLLNYEKHRDTIRHETAKEQKRNWYHEHRDEVLAARKGTVRPPLEPVSESTRPLSVSASGSDSVLEGETGEPTPEPPHASELMASRFGVSNEGTLPRTLRELPDGFETPEAVYARAAELGLSRAQVDERMSTLKLGPIGGARGVLVKKLEAYLLDQVGKWRTWHETDRAREQAGPGLAKTRPPGSSWEPNAKARAFAKKHELDIDAIARDYVRSGEPVSRGGGRDADDAFGKRLSKASREGKRA